MRMLLSAVAALLLTSCDRGEAPPKATPAPTSAPVSIDAAPEQPNAAPADGDPLAFLDAGGAPIATLRCGPDGLRIVVPGFQPISSEDRLSVGTDGEAYALVADLAAPGPGVTASGAPDPELLDRLARGEALFASYGSQSAGPLAAASPAGLRAMISTCRRQE